MMRHKYLIILLLAGHFLLLASPTQPQPKGGAMMDMDAFTPIAKGYDFVREGKYEAAKFEFETALKRDPYNPFALNNLAVLEEREGKLNDALAHLKDATTHAAYYNDKVVQTCFAGGGLLQVKPARATGEQSTILPIIQENIKKLGAKMSDDPMPPPSLPPKKK